MSTVADVYNFIQYRPDIQVTIDDLVHVVDQAVRTIAKRLYVLESDLITGQMEVKVFAEVEYTSDTIAFADTGPDTITDSDSKFVTEGFVADMPITTDASGNAGPFKIATAVAGTLTLSATDAVTAALAGSDVTITSDASFGYLPTDFWGLKGKPYIDGKDYTLTPLPSVDVEIAYPSSGEPRHYKIRGTKFYITPSTSTDYTIKADYFQRPTSITTTTATLPFNELFDDLIAEYAVKYFRGAKTEGMPAESLLSKMVIENVDLIANRYDRRAPVEFPQAVDWDNI